MLQIYSKRRAIIFLLMMLVLVSTTLRSEAGELNKGRKTPYKVLEQHQEEMKADIPGQIHVIGTVKDKLGNPLIGVTLKVKGKTEGTVTDENGRFALDVVPTDSLVVSYVGYQTMTLAVRNQTDMEITLKAKEGSLNEVVVVAYGEQKKESVTGSLATIGTKELRQSPAANLAVSLAGRLPGLTAIQRSGQPGADLTQLFIRGRSTTNTQSPLILVDGVERDLKFIDPNEVKSVTILKDASATALYGVRGANGVILVTTKRGESKVPKISLTAEAAAQSFTRHLQPVNAYNYAILKNEALENDGINPAYNADEIEHYKVGDEPLKYPNNNWWEKMVKDYSLQQRYNLTVSGKGKRVGYFVDLGYLNQGGQFKTEKGLGYDPSFKLNRYNFRSNIDLNLTKSLKAYLNLAGYLEKENTPRGIASVSPSTNPTIYLLTYIANFPQNTPGPLTPSGEVLTNTVNADNLHPPYGQLNRSGYVQATRTNITATYGMQQSLGFLTKGLSVKAEMSFDTRAENDMAATKTYEVYTQQIDSLPGGGDSVSYRKVGESQNSPLDITGDNDYSTLSNVQAYLNYNRDFDRHAVTGLLLFQRQKNIINRDLPYNVIGFSGRFTYAYNQKYFFEFNAGYNGSEQFSPKNRFGFFPAVSGAWLLSKENLLKDNRIITLLKLRGSWGKVGNDRISNRRFLYLDDIQLESGGFGSLDNGQKVVISLLKNDKLQWEVSTETNLGLDMELFHSLSLNLDVFQQKRTNVLLTRGTIPILYGLSNSVIPPMNIGIIENKGFELEVGYKKIFSDQFSLISKANFNFDRNKQLFVDEPELSNAYAYRYRNTGYSIGQQFGYKVLGYFTSEEQINHSPVQSVGGHPSRLGDFKYADLNGDGVVNEKDRAPIGYPNVPEITFGASFQLSYKNFDLSMLLQGVDNVSTYFSGNGIFPSENFMKRHIDAWTIDRQKTGEPITYPRLTTQTSPNEISNSFFIVNSSYIRLKNAELGYRLPSKISKKIKASEIRFYLNGLNIFTWDRLPFDGFDPEMNSTQTYPNLRVFNLGVHVEF